MGAKETIDELFRPPHNRVIILGPILGRRSLVRVPLTFSRAIPTTLDDRGNWIAEDKRLGRLDLYHSAHIKLGEDLIVFDSRGYARSGLDRILCVGAAVNPLVAIKGMPCINLSERGRAQLIGHVHNGRFCYDQCCFACGSLPPAAYYHWGHIVKPLCEKCLAVRGMFEGLVGHYWHVRMAAGSLRDTGTIIWASYQAVMCGYMRGLV
jgi:hypothetical protein